MKDTYHASGAAEPVAVIGMACIFPGAPDLRSYWSNILNCVNAIGEPLPAWNADLYLNRRRVTTTAKGGYLKDLYRFNPGEFGIMPRAVDGGEPDQFLALAVAKAALADAGAGYLAPEFDHSATGVILGHSPYYHRGQVNTAQHLVFVEQIRDLVRAMVPEMTDAQEEQLAALLKEQLPAFNPDVSPGLVPNVMTGRIANRLNLHGPNYMIDAACASSLLAVKAGIEELRNRTSRMMLVGGVNASLPPEVAVIFSQLGALSRSGAVKPFAQSADGTLLGEGLGVIVLKRVDEAIADGDRIYALLRGVGTSSDGRGLGLLTPSLDGEVLAMRRAYDQSGIDPASITLVEAHGTGIPLGDRTEIGALRQIYGPRSGEFGRVAIGSVKALISHCIPAAGIASLIKTCLALHSRILPPSPCDTVSPDLDIAHTNLFVNTAARPWVSPPDEPRRAGVNAFGFGGVNAHAILEEAPAAAVRPCDLNPWPEELFCFRGPDRAAILAQLDRADSFAERNRDTRLADLAFTLAGEAAAAAGSCRLAVVAGDIADLRRKLDQARRKLKAEAAEFTTRNGLSYSEAPIAGKLAFMFPGEGSQYLYMLADLARYFEPARHWLDFWMGATAGDGGLDRIHTVYPVESEATEERCLAFEAGVRSMGVGSEAAFIGGQAVFATLGALGVTADVMVGHSTGESAALVASGVVRAGDAAESSAQFRKISGIGQMVEASGQVPTGALVAVGLLGRDQIADAIQGTEALITMENAPNQTVIYMPEAAVEHITGRLCALGAVCERLPFDRGYHSPAFLPMQLAFETFYRELGLSAPQVPLYSCATVAPFPAEPEAILQVAAGQWSSPVRFPDTIARLYGDGVRMFVEVGPGSKLTSFAQAILRDRKAFPEPVLAAASDGPALGGIGALLRLIGQLFVNGRAAPGAVFARRDLSAVDLAATAPKALPGVFVDNSIPRIRATPEVAALLQTLRHQSRTGPATAGTAAAPAASAEPAAGRYPFLSRITASDRNSLRAVVTCDIRTDLYLQDHVLSGPVSDDDELYGLPCVPLMASVEILAEAAAALLGRRDLSLVENLVTERWIAVESDQIWLEVSARRLSDSAAEVTLFHAGKRAVSARLTFGAELDPPAGLAPIEPEAEYWLTEPFEIYREHMFHGPIFQSVDRVVAWSGKGLVATLSRSGLAGFFRSGETPDFILNPVILDALTQVTAFWLAQAVGPHFATFPRTIRRILVHAPAVEGVDGLWVHAERAESQRAGSDGIWTLSCCLGDERLITVEALENAFSYLPPAYYPYSLEPINGWMGRPVHVDDTLGNVVWDLPLLPMEFWERIGGVFLRVLAFSTLGQAERRLWHALSEDLSARARWLMPRVALKEALRWWLHAVTGVRFHSADIEVRRLPDGSWTAAGGWTDLAEPPALYLTEEDGTIRVFLCAQAAPPAGHDTEDHEFATAFVWETQP